MNYLLFHDLLRNLQLVLILGYSASLVNLSLTVLSLAQSQNCHLATLTTVWPVEGKRESLVQRLRRWLISRNLKRGSYYNPLIEKILVGWKGVELPLVTDRTDLNTRWSLLLLGIAFKGRVIPLAWLVLPYGSTSAMVQIELLKQIEPLWRNFKHLRVTLFADAEFRAVELQKYCQKNDWHWQLGVKGDTCFRYPDSNQWQPLSTAAPKKGKRAYLHNVYFTKEHDFGLVSLIIDWPTTQKFPRYVVLDHCASRPLGGKG